MSALAQIREARALIGYLFEPGHPAMVYLVTHAGPLAALTQLRRHELPSTALRRELRAMAPQQLWRRAEQAVGGFRGRILIPEDADWPAGLSSPQPLCLWTDGPATGALSRSVAVTGSRAATSYGVHVASEFGHDLAAQDVTVATTGGFGIAAAALRGALAAAGQPVAVLGGGLDRPYPAGNATLLASLRERGLLLSAAPPGAEVTRTRQQSAARMLAELTTGTVLVEASRRSSALATVLHAAGLRRLSLVVPGPVTAVTSAGGLDLLRTGAPFTAVGDAGHVLAALAAVRNDDSAAPAADRQPDA